MSILLPKIMKIAQKISLLGLKKYLQDKSQQSLITAFTITKNSFKISPKGVKTSGNVHCVNYNLTILKSMHKIHKNIEKAKKKKKKIENWESFTCQNRAVKT